MQFKCPTNPDPTHTAQEGEPIIGCGEVFEAEPDQEGLVDCPHCGIWFKADEPGVRVS